jgi:hypothetical protein
MSLSIDQLIDVVYSITPSPAQSQNLTNLLALTTNTVIDTVERIRTYANSTDVGVDFGDNSLEFSLAELFFGQTPQPASLSIGRWCQAAAAGKLLCAPLTPTQQAIANFTGIADGGFTVSLDGVVDHLSGIDLTAQTNLNGVAAQIQIALGGGVTCVWNSVYERFEITSATTGAASAVSFLSAPTAVGAVDISDLIGGHNVAGNGAYVANGIVAETALAAVTLFDQRFGGQWYALVVPQAVDADHEAIAPFIESGATRRHFYGITTQEAGTFSSASTTDLAYILAQLDFIHTAICYSSTSTIAIVSALARILTVDYTQPNSTITLMWKQLPGLIPENLTNGQVAVLQSKNCNVYADLDNGQAIFLTGTTVSTDVFIDTVMGADNFAIACKNALFADLYVQGKIAQTDAGMHQLVTDLETVAVQFVSNGYLGPGTWTGAGFGSLQTNQFMEKGYYIYAAPLATQSAQNRAARMAGPITIAAKLAGAIHTASVSITLNP